MDPTTAALVVAALGVAAGPVTAWLTFWWGRDQERERRTAERQADAERWEREERRRRVTRGEDAAGRILDVIDGVAMTMATKNVAQADIRPQWHEMRRLAELLTDDRVRDAMFSIADGLFYFPAAVEADARITQHQIADTAASAAHEVIRAYLHDRPLPRLNRLERLRQLEAEGGDILFDTLEPDDYYDPLADPMDTAGPR